MDPIRPINIRMFDTPHVLKGLWPLPWCEESQVKFECLTGWFARDLGRMVLACYALDVAWWLVPLMLSWLHSGYLKPSVESGLHQSYSSSADEV